MRHLKHILILLIAINAMLAADAQVYVLTNNDTIVVSDPCSIGTGYIFDDGGPDGYYSNDFNGWIVVTGGTVPVRLTGSYSTESCCDRLSVWDGTTLVVNDVGGNGTVDVTCTSGSMTLYFHTDGSAQASGLQLQFSVGVAIDPAGVTGLVADNVTANSATLQWNSTGSGPFHVLLDGVEVGTTSAMTYSVTGLSTASYHEAAVYADGLENNFCAYDTTVFRMACGDVQLPFSEGFEGVAEGVMPPCWASLANFDDADVLPQVVQAQHRSGENSLMLSCGNNLTASHFGIVASPPLTGGGQAYVDFSLMASHSGTVVVLGICDFAGNDIANYSFMPIETLTLWEEGVWTTHRISWNATSHPRRLAFYMVQSSQSGAGRRVYIDDMGVTSCGVDSLVAQHVTETSVDLSWVVRGNPTSTVRVHRRGSMTTEQTIANAVSPLTISGLQGGTEYIFTVSPDCGIVRSVTAMTESPAPSANGFCCDFRHGGILVSGWTFLAPGGSNFDLNNGRVNFYANGVYRHAYMVSPRLAGLGGKKVAVQYNTGYTSCAFTIGAMAFADDSATFVPLVTLPIINKDSTVVFTIPEGVDSQYFAIRYDFEDPWYSVDVYSVQIGTEMVGDVRVLHRRGTTLTVEWDTVYGSNQLAVEVGPRGFVPGTGTVTYHTLAAGQHRITIGGLWPQTDYDVLLYTQGGVPCGGRRLETRTVLNDLELPYCQDFENMYNHEFDYWSYDWNAPRGVANCPRINDYYADWNYYTRALELSSMGFDWDYYSVVMLPDVYLDSADTIVVGMYVTDDAPQSMLEVGIMPDRYAWYEQYFLPIDTIQMAAPHTRMYYSVTVPVSETLLRGRLCLRYRHSEQYHFRVCHIDQLSISAVGYGNLTYPVVGYTDATLSLDALTGMDSVDVVIVSDNDTVVHRFAADAIGSMPIAGLDSGTYYRVYLRPVPDSIGCQFYAGHFITNSFGIGAMAPCFTFDELLSYELPTGWQFGDSARVDGDVLVFNGMAVLPVRGNLAGKRLTLRLAAQDSLLVGYTGDGTSFVTLASATADSVAMLLPETPDTAWLALFAPDTVHLGMIGVGISPVVDIVSEGGRVVCTQRGSNRQNYTLIVIEEGDSVGTRYNVTDNPFTIVDLLLGHTYQIFYGSSADPSDCWPEVTVTVSDSLTLPYCETFELENGGTGIPENWTFFYDNGLQRQLEVGWGELPLRFGEWGWANQKAVLPAISHDGPFTVRVRAHIWTNNVFAIGTVAANMDTSTFVPLVTNGIRTGWVDMTVNIDTIAGRRIALRSDDLVLIDRVSVSTLPYVDIQLVDSRTLRLVADRNMPYWVHYTDGYGLDSSYRVTVNPYLLQVEEYINDVNLGLSSDSLSDACSGQQWYQLSERRDLPLCPQNEYWDWDYRVIGDAWDDYYRGRRPQNMRSNNDVNNYAYRLFPDFNIDSVRHLTMSFDLSADWIGDRLEVGVMSNAYDTATFEPVDTVQYTLPDGGWQHFVVDFSRYGGTGRWIAFRHRSGQCTSCYGQIATSRYYVTACPAAAATASLSRWNMASIDAPDTGFYVEFGLAGFSQGSGTVMYVDSLPFHVMLTADAAYDFYFRCSSDGSSCDNPQRVTTLSEPLQVPVCVDFDTAAAGTMLRNWTVYGTGSVTSDVSHSAPNCIGIGVSTRSFVVSPDVDIDDISQVALSLWFRADQQSDRLVVGTMSNPADISTFYALRSFAPQAGGGWQHINVSFENAPASHHFIALRARNNGTSMGAHTLYVDDIHVTTCAAFDMRIDEVDNSHLTISWKEIGSPSVTLKVIDNGSVSTYTPTGGTFTTAVVPQHNYTVTMHAQCTPALGCAVPYDDTIHIVGPAEARGCVNPTDLHSPDAVFLSGSYQNPYDMSGAVDMGSGSADSRHTVCYDTSERDSRTGGLLRTIPEGATSSVRLGNWNTGVNGPEAEGVIYSLFVDTMSFNLLIMRYAAVLQDPLHAPEDQPRFRLELLDSSFNLIDPECASADFVANRDLGWNEAADNVLWKDWTTFGVDVRNYADQHIYVRLTTYDCNEGSHYGYAYFTLECMRDNIVTETCGVVDSNTFSAPMGFNYRWYTLPSNTTVATTQSFVSGSNNSTYYCDVISMENPSCMFTISAYAGSRYPMAAFDTSMTIHDCGFTVRFRNNSVVSADGVHPLPSGEQCETALWNFGNGHTSTNYHGETFYDTPGTYTVTLVSGIAGGSCTDTAVLVINIAFPTEIEVTGPDTLCYGVVDSLVLLNGQTDGVDWQNADGYQRLLLDTSAYALGDNSYTVTASNAYGCTVTINRTLYVKPSYRFTDTMVICTPMLPYSYADTVFGPGTGEVFYDQETRTTDGCDSSYHLWLIVSDTTANTERDTVVASICDNESYLFFGTNYNTAGTHMSVHLDSEGVCDSIHSLLLDVRATTSRDTAASPCDEFTWYGTHYVYDTNTVRMDTNSVGCDSVTTLHLTLRHSTTSTITRHVVENNLPYIFNGIAFGTSVSRYVMHIENSVDCDSTINFTLIVHWNRDTTVYKDVCEGLMPLTWNGVVFNIEDADLVSDTIVRQTMLQTTAGADSLVTMHLHVLRNSSAAIADTLVQNDLAAYAPPLGLDVEYEQNEYDPTLVLLVDTTMVIANAVGCDSSVHYTLHIYRNRHMYDTATCCDNQLPYTYLDSLLVPDADSATYQFELSTSYGTDSIVSFTIVVNPTYEVADTHVICPHQPYLYEEVDYGGPIEFDSPHVTIHGCDSLVHVTLMPRDTLFRLAPIVSRDSMNWLPCDSLLLGCTPQRFWLNDTSQSVGREWTFWPAGEPDSAVTDTSRFFSGELQVGVYSYQLVAEGREGCVDTIVCDSAIYIFERPVPDFRWEPFRIPNHDPQIELFPSGMPDGILTFSWLVATAQEGEQYDSILRDGMIGGHWMYRWEDNIEHGDYDVAVVAYWLHSVGGQSVECTDTVWHPVTIVNTFLQFPNLVTPNGDGENDIWGVVNLIEYNEYLRNELWIYDRSGSLVYHVRDIETEGQFWDPNATNSPDGTYYYRFSGQSLYGVVKRNGIIEVLR